MINLIKDTNSINDIDISTLGSYVIEDQFRSYFLDTPGREHYRLLACISDYFTNSTLIDIGTYKGCSALALSKNKTNEVKSFDIGHGLRRLSESPNNIEFIVDNIIDQKYVDMIKSSKFILLDTNHDGTFELEFYSHLKNLKYKGYLMLDDIYFNDPMRSFWEAITEEKYDISNIGHHSGTGLVIFN